MRTRLLATLTAAAALALTGCGAPATEPETSAPRPISQAPTTSNAPPTLTATEQLPSVDNTDIDPTDPDEVAYEFIRLSTTFLPGDVFDPQAASERGYPLATDRYREAQAPASNPDVARIHGWWNQGAPADDPVVVVESSVEFTDKPDPEDTGETTTTRHLQSTQTPITESGRHLPARVQNATLTLVKQDNDHWLVDVGDYHVVDN